MSRHDLIKSEVREEPDGQVRFTRRAPIDYDRQVPKDLLRRAPKWAESLLERGTTFVELVESLAQKHAARKAWLNAEVYCVWSNKWR